jgi:ankyrin repeat protein
MPTVTEKRARQAAGALEIIHEMLKMKPDVNLADRYGSTPLMYAMTAAPIEVIEEIIRRGANLEAETGPEHGNGAGLRAIHFAVIFDRVDVIELLARRGTNLSKPLPDGRSILEFARHQRSQKAMPILEKLLAQARSR